MMRPIYETEEDQSREAQTLREFALSFPDMTFKKTPPLHSADYEIYASHGYKAYVEVKNRTNDYKKYPTYMISKSKIDSILELANSEGCKAGLVVRWADLIGYISLEDYVNHSETGVGGRYDRGDRQDVESVYYCPIEFFTVLDPPGLRSEST